MAKLITWDATISRFKEVSTGLVLSDTAEPVTIADGDAWINTAGMTFSVYVGGVSYELGDLQ